MGPWLLTQFVVVEEESRSIKITFPFFSLTLLQDCMLDDSVTLSLTLERHKSRIRCSSSYSNYYHIEKREVTFRILDFQGWRIKRLWSWFDNSGMNEKIEWCLYFKSFKVLLGSLQTWIEAFNKFEFISFLFIDYKLKLYKVKSTAMINWLFLLIWQTVLLGKKGQL